MSGGTQQAPTPYQPPNQAGAASGFQQGTNQLATAGSNLYSSVAPQFSNIVSNVSNNPYYTQAQTGAQNAANLATSAVAPGQFAGASQDAGIAALAGQAGSAYANYANGMLPQATAGLNAAPGVFNQAQSLIPATTQPELAAGMSVLNTGFDPQQALYNQQFQQQKDQTNATAGQSGLAGSPYAASISNQANTNFNINWQNAQLARQIQALGAYDSAASTAAGNLSNLQTTGVQNFDALTSGATNSATNLINTGIGSLSTLGNQAVSANTAASQLGTAGLNTVAGAAQLPQDIYLQQQQAQLAALGAQITGTNSALQPTQQAVADQGQYLGIGQTAAQGATNAAQVNNQASAASTAAWTSLFGDVAGMLLV